MNQFFTRFQPQLPDIWIENICKSLSPVRNRNRTFQDCLKRVDKFGTVQLHNTQSSKEIDTDVEENYQTVLLFVTQSFIPSEKISS